MWLFADILQKLMASFAFLVGGFWVLMNYVRNRTHVPRLQVEVTAELVRFGPRQYLIATCHAKNVGLSIIRLPPPEAGGVGPRGSALVVRAFPQFNEIPYMVEVPWSENPASVFEIFGNHRFIEPGLTITEQKLIFQPTLADGAWVQLRVSAHNQKWTAVAVAVLEEAARSVE